jgi:outer membrane protein OmpA-like peptidoglycan-associated protein
LRGDNREWLNWLKKLISKRRIGAIGPLFYARWDTNVETMAEKRVAGYKVNNIHFDVDQYDLTPAGKEELAGVGKFMSEYPKAYAVLFGFTDDTGLPGLR